MSFFTNKHVITAFIVAPILAALSYYLVDRMVKEKPHHAVAGHSYPLVAQSNCRYTSGKCDLSNKDFKAQLTVEHKDEQATLVVESGTDLNKVSVGYNSGDDKAKQTPEQMVYVPDLNQWQSKLPNDFTQDTSLMIVLQTENNNFYAETKMKFSEYQTTFNKTF